MQFFGLLMTRKTIKKRANDTGNMFSVNVVKTDLMGKRGVKEHPTGVFGVPLFAVPTLAS